MIRHSPNAQITESPRPWRVSRRLSVFGAVASLTNLWTYTASGWQKITPSIYTSTGWQNLIAAWVYTASGWQKAYG